MAAWAPGVRWARVPKQMAMAARAAVIADSLLSNRSQAARSLMNDKLRHAIAAQGDGLRTGPD